jgi:nucleoside-diphosphate-sugar epimerase
VREGAPLKLDGADGVRMNPIHVDDAASAIAALLGSTLSGVVNIAGPDVLSMREIGGILGEACAKPASFEATGGTPASRIASTEKLRALFTPALRLRDRARELV